MTCIDHLLRFPDEATAKADPIVGKYYTPASDDGPGQWRGDVCLPGLSVYTIATGQADAGWFLLIALPALDQNLRDLPNGACRLIADRDAANAGSQSFILYTASDVTQAELASKAIAPTFAGSNYPFGTS